MPITISVDQQALPKGALIYLTRICSVPNGGSVTLTDEQAKRFNRRFPNGLSSGIFNVSNSEAPPNKEDETTQENTVNEPVITTVDTEDEGGEKN